eukprot:TRINITY_DN39176_c0_g1_i1.p1 TRINITY_DN39176_c0_g1~~TRINITY_DN39176_c0_g1_i1.p1  ORF type:complete len:908 (-),score=141.87 TRINITY_DN39176_c0_g1_i1:15-2711(-)
MALRHEQSEWFLFVSDGSDVANSTHSVPSQNAFVDSVGSLLGYLTYQAVVWAGVAALVLWVLVTCGFACCKGDDTVYESITCSSVMPSRRKRDFRQFCNYLRLVPLHLLRSLEIPSGDRCLYSSTEKLHLSAQRSVYNDAVVNFLAVRRSMAFVTACFAMLSLAAAITDVRNVWYDWKVWKLMSQTERDGHVISFKEFVEESGKPFVAANPDAWFRYTLYLYGGVYAKLINQMSYVDVFECSLTAGSSLVSCLLLWWSLKKWSQFSLSSSAVMQGWAFTVVIPFLTTLVPGRILIDWRGVEATSASFSEQVVTHFGKHSLVAAEQLNQTCTSILELNRSSVLQDVRERTESVCSLLQTTPDEHVECCSFIGLSIIDFDFRPLHKSCGVLKGYMADPDSAAHEKVLRKSADLCDSMLMPRIRHALTLGLSGSEVLQLQATSEALAKKLEEGVEVLVGAMNGLKGFKKIMPVALALAPALMKGALRVKVTVPQSTIPGMFVVTLPLLYCPFTWAVYHIFFQLLGDVWMLLGLLIIAFGPMCYAVLGHCYQVTRPLDDAAVINLMAKLNTVSLVVTIVGYAFIGYVVYLRRHRLLGGNHSLEDELWRYVGQKVALLQPVFWIRLVGSFMTQYFFTTLAGVDWMMVQIGRHRHYEMLLEISDEIGDLECSGSTDDFPLGLRTPNERALLQKVAAERRQRLDCVYFINYKEAPMRVVWEEDEGQSTRVNKRIASTYKPPESKSLGDIELPVVKARSTAVSEVTLERFKEEEESCRDSPDMEEDVAVFEDAKDSGRSKWELKRLRARVRQLEAELAAAKESRSCVQSRGGEESLPDHLPRAWGESLLPNLPVESAGSAGPAPEIRASRSQPQRDNYRPPRSVRRGGLGEAHKWKWRVQKNETPE